MVGLQAVPPRSMEPLGTPTPPLPEAAPASFAPRLRDAQGGQHRDDLVGRKLGQRPGSLSTEAVHRLGNNGVSANRSGRHGTPDQVGGSGPGGKLRRTRSGEREAMRCRWPWPSSMRATIFMMLLPAEPARGARRGCAGRKRQDRREGRVIDDAQARVQKVDNHAKPLFAQKWTLARSLPGLLSRWRPLHRGRQPSPSIFGENRHRYLSVCRIHRKQRLSPRLTVCFLPAFTTFAHAGAGQPMTGCPSPAIRYPA